MNHAEYCAQFIHEGGRILDVGSGKGKILCQMSLLDFEVHGVEINQEYINISLEQATKEGITLAVTRAEAEKLPFPDEYFDFVNCAEVTEHLEDPELVCKEIYRVLNPNGRSYISFHNRFSIYDYHYHLYGINWLPRRWAESILKILKKQKLDGEVGRQKLATMHYYTYRQVHKLFKNIGFEAEDIRVEKIKKQFSFLTKEKT